MKIGIFGASGFIGHALFKYYQFLGEPIIGTFNTMPLPNLIHLDILACNDFSIFDSCDLVVIAGGITKIAQCNTNYKVAHKINVEKTIHLISALSEKGIKPVFLSSDNVFDGIKGNYAETDPINPINAYGEFKAEVEQFMEEQLENYMVIRLTKNYTKNSTSESIYSEIINNLSNNQEILLADDLIFNPTEVEQTVFFIDKLLRLNIVGIYHVASKNVESRYQFGLRLAEDCALNKNLIKKIHLDELRLPYRMPKNVSFDVSKMYDLISKTTEA